MPVPSSTSVQLPSSTSAIDECLNRPCSTLTCSAYTGPLTCQQIVLAFPQCDCQDCCTEVPPPPPPPLAACEQPCGGATCGKFRPFLTCSQLKAWDLCGTGCPECCVETAQELLTAATGIASDAPALPPPATPPLRSPDHLQSASKWPSPGKGNKQGGCAGSKLIKETFWTYSSLAECEAGCDQEPECVAIEFGFVNTPPAGTTVAEQTRGYPQCKMFEVGSKITHVVPRPVECYIKPAVAVAGPGGCPITKQCQCCHLARPGADFTAGGGCENLVNAVRAPAPRFLGCCPAWLYRKNGCLRSRVAARYYTLRIAL